MFGITYYVFAHQMPNRKNSLHENFNAGSFIFFSACCLTDRASRHRPSRFTVWTPKAFGRVAWLTYVSGIVVSISIQLSFSFGSKFVFRLVRLLKAQNSAQKPHLICPFNPRSVFYIFSFSWLSQNRTGKERIQQTTQSHSAKVFGLNTKKRNSKPSFFFTRSVFFFGAKSTKKCQ